jgi:hypothetical protein
MPLAGLPQANKYDQRDSPAEKEMRVRTREHVRNEGSRRFKSAPLRQLHLTLECAPASSGWLAAKGVHRQFHARLGRACLFFQRVNENLPSGGLLNLGEFVSLFVSVLYFKVSQFFFKLTYSLKTTSLGPSGPLPR